MDLPKISIVTPSYNQGQFLEETIKSVVNQNYPDLEYIIIDGGSTDGSVDIIKKYKQYLTYWTSEPDNGQSHAINKGFQKTTGDIVGWLNSDDLYMPNALDIIGAYFRDNRDVDAVYGNQAAIDEKGEIFRSVRVLNFNRLVMLAGASTIPQPASFFKRKLLEEIGYLDESLNWYMDYEFFLRVAFAGYQIRHIPQVLAKFRYHKTSKTMVAKIDSNKSEECLRLVQKRYIEKGGRYYKMWFLNLIRIYFSAKRRLINIDRYIINCNYYLRRIKSRLTGGNLHRY